ncbi:MAG: hypothetical protein ACJBCI_02935 [Candidatus Tisiphia sp.]
MQGFKEATKSRLAAHSNSVTDLSLGTTNKLPTKVELCKKSNHSSSSLTLIFK